MGTILVTGGTGTLGRIVVERLVGPGRQVRVLSRRSRPAPGHAASEWAVGDLRTGQGVAAAVEGAEIIIHCASSPRGDARAARNLVEAARPAGARHVVYISIVGAERVPLGYYHAKVEAEKVIEDSGLPWTILRTTQFHELILRGCVMLARLPVMLVPAGTSFQPIDVREVADRLAGLAVGQPAGRVRPMGGPQVRSCRELALSYLAASGRRRYVLPVRLPGAVLGGYRRGGHLTPGFAVGRVTFEQFLAERMPAQQPVPAVVRGRS
jgi:uncharacterized protein YbjT (DUF2867 family)